MIDDGFDGIDVWYCGRNLGARGVWHYAVDGPGWGVWERGKARGDR